MRKAGSQIIMVVDHDEPTVLDWNTNMLAWKKGECLNLSQSGCSSLPHIFCPLCEQHF